MDLKLRTEGGRNDVDLTNGRLSFVTKTAAVAQKVYMKLQSFMGESVYDIAGGTAWLQPGAAEQNEPTMYIFENTSQPVLNAQTILTDAVNAVEGVKGVTALVVNLDRASRVASVSGKARVESGDEFEFNVSVGGA